MLLTHLRPRQNGRHLQHSLRFVPGAPANNIWALFQMAWRWPAIILIYDGLITDVYMRHSASMS